jgi:hypothetical protein
MNLQWQRLMQRDQPQRSLTPQLPIGRAARFGPSLEAAVVRRLPSVGWFCAKSQTRESRDNPMLKAFCRVAPSVRFNALAILASRVFYEQWSSRRPNFSPPLWTTAALTFALSIIAQAQRPSGLGPNKTLLRRIASLH